MYMHEGANTMQEVLHLMFQRRFNLFAPAEAESNAMKLGSCSDECMYPSYNRRRLRRFEAIEGNGGGVGVCRPLCGATQYQTEFSVLAEQLC